MLRNLDPDGLYLPTIKPHSTRILHIVAEV